MEKLGLQAKMKMEYGMFINGLREEYYYYSGQEF